MSSLVKLQNVCAAFFKIHIQTFCFINKQLKTPGAALFYSTFGKRKLLSDLYGKRQES